MNKISKIILCIVIITNASCTKERSYIEIITPINGAFFNPGDTVRINADLWNTDALFTERLIITTGSNNVDTVFTFYDNTANYGGKYRLSKEFITQPSLKYKILITANGSGEPASDSLYVYSN